MPPRPRTPRTALAAFVLLLLQFGSAGAQTQFGYIAELSNLSTVGVSGTVEIVGPTSIRFYNFNYDGRGGGLTELALLPDRGPNTLRNNNIIGVDNGFRVDVINGRVQQVVADPDLFPSAPPVEFDTATPIATIRSAVPEAGLPPVGGDALPFVNFNGVIDFNEISGFGDNGESLTDFAGISVNCIPFGIDFGSGIFTNPADFTNDGVVSAADFVLFRDTAGLQVSAPALPGQPERVFDTPGELGDANLDGQVTLADYDRFVEAFGTRAAAADPATAAAIMAFNDHSDADFEAIAAELATLAAAIATQPADAGVGPFLPLASATAAVPEPGALALAALGLAMPARRRR